MLRNIRIIPLADESLGVRSMAVYVETSTIRVLLDAGVSLAPKRYGLLPHPAEFEALKEAREKILRFSKKADVITVSHYHLDHYTPNFVSWYEWTSPEIFNEIYSNKTVFIKSITSNINFNQKRRGFVFRRELEKVTDYITEADGRMFEYGNVRLMFSPPLPHGPENTKLGYVLLVTISTEDEKILYAPDVQGPISQEVKRYIISVKPDLIILGGPPSYLSGIKVREEDIMQGVRNLKEVLATSNKVVLSHHILRDLNWKDLLEDNGVDPSSVILYSNMLEVEFTPLEALRKILYESDPPSQEFLQWLRKKDKSEPPPL
ncbi:MAG: hypothetical protein DRJ64_02460 [Thermoprotei archaeon]|nr:MAG: hypothetical protein B6U94_01310 [Thermofilum sp. ex4484_79]RLF07720.1 MAG: hypothetical protein DRJ64_02460 [Thermoprotei archaeon]